MEIPAKEGEEDAQVFGLHIHTAYMEIDNRDFEAEHMDCIGDWFLLYSRNNATFMYNYTLTIKFKDNKIGNNRRPTEPQGKYT